MYKNILFFAFILSACSINSTQPEPSQLDTANFQTIDPDIHKFLPIEVYIPLFRYPTVRTKTKEKIFSKLQSLYPEEKEVEDIRFPCRLDEGEQETLIAIALADHGIEPEDYLAVRKSLSEITNPPNLMQGESGESLKNLDIFEIIQSARKRDTFSDSVLLQTPKNEFLEQKKLYGFSALSQAFNYDKCRQNNESPIILETVLYWLDTDSPSEDEVSQILEIAWVMVQHLDDQTDTQLKFLEIMKLNGFKNKKAKRQYAYLYDRIKINSGEPQRYGTQVFYTPTGCSPGKLEDKQSLENLRSEMGLGSLREYYSSHPGC